MEYWMDAFRLKSIVLVLLLAILVLFGSSTLSVDQRRPWPERGARIRLPVVRRRGGRRPRRLRRLHPSQARPEPARLRRSAAVLARAGRVARRAEVARQFAHVLVDEYQDTNPLQAQILLALRRDEPQPDGGRRRRPVHLLVPLGQRAQHPGVPDAVPGRAAHHARAELPLDAADPGRGQRGHRRSPRGFSEDPVFGAPGWRAAAAADVLRRGRAEPPGVRERARASRAGHSAAPASGAVPRPDTTATCSSSS